MKITIESHQLNGLLVLKPEVFQDDRGFFLEAFRKDQFLDLGLPGEFVQDNHSKSVKGSCPRSSFPIRAANGELMRVTVGTAYLMAVDIRKGSPTLGKWLASRCRLKTSCRFGRRRDLRGDSAFFPMWPRSSTSVQVSTATRANRESDGMIPAIGITWPVSNPTLSKKDEAAQTLAEWLQRPESEKFRY